MYMKSSAPEPPRSAAPPVEEIKLLLAQARLEEAFQLVARLKARREPFPELDSLRAECFLQKGLPYAAIESLREELRYFPDNQAAAAELERLLGLHGAEPVAGDAEFRELVRAIRSRTMLYALARQVCEEDLPGNFVECGVAAGGSSALLATAIARFSRRPRRLYSFDTFEGMPLPAVHDTHEGQGADATGWGAGTCSAPETSLMEICRQLGVDHLVEACKGNFANTLPTQRLRLGAIALLHADGDWHASTRDILENLYDQVVAGGRLQIDDYGYWSGCRQAVSEFEATRRLKFDMHVIDETGVWLIKPSP